MARQVRRRAVHDGGKAPASESGYEGDEAARVRAVVLMERARSADAHRPR